MGRKKINRAEKFFRRCERKFSRPENFWMGWKKINRAEEFFRRCERKFSRPEHFWMGWKKEDHNKKTSRLVGRLLYSNSEYIKIAIRYSALKA
jgi:hypothetical protein